MRIRPPALLLVPVLALTLAACGGSSNKADVNTDSGTGPSTATLTTPTAPATDTGATNPLTGTAGTTPVVPPADAELGKRLVIAGILDGERVAVTVLDVRDPVRITSETPFEPGEGNRYYAVKLKVENVGPVPTNESPLTAARLFVDGGAVEPEILSAVAPGFDGNPTIETRGELTGWVTFEISQNAVPQRLKYTPRAGFSKESGSWRLS